MKLSFREKSLWLLLFGLLIIYGWYFASVLPHHAANVGPGQIVTFIGMTILLAVFQIIGHILLATMSLRELAAEHVQADERDALIQLKSTRIAWYVLATGVFASLCVALIMPGNFAFMHTMLAFWVFAEAAGIVSQLVLYRRGM